MSGDHIPGNEINNPLCNERGGATRTLLLVLLFVVAAAGYLFYFTDFIKPLREEGKPSVAQPSQVKQPIPPRPGQPGGKEAVQAKPGEAKPSPGTPAPPPAKPEPVKTAKAEAPPKPAPPPAAAPKPAPAATPPPAAPAAKKEPLPAKPVQKAEKPAGEKKGGPYRLLVGDFVPDKTFDAVLSKLKKSGIAPVRKSDMKTAEPMNRLYVATFPDQDTAEAELAKLRKLTADAFLIPENDKYLLYAGSYLSPNRAASELGKLNAKGVRTVIKKAQVPVRVTRVTAGSYASSEEARKDGVLLKKQGFEATVIKAK